MGIVRPTESRGRFGGPRLDKSRLGATLIWLDLSSDFFIVPRDFLSVRAGLTQSVYPDAHALLSQGGLFLLLRFCSSAQSHSSIRGGWTNTPRHDRYDGGSI